MQKIASGSINEHKIDSVEDSGYNHLRIDTNEMIKEVADRSELVLVCLATLTELNEY